MDDIELETRSMVDEGAELKHGVTCLRSRPIENSLMLQSQLYAKRVVYSYWSIEIISLVIATFFLFSKLKNTLGLQLICALNHRLSFLSECKISVHIHVICYRVSLRLLKI